MKILLTLLVVLCSYCTLVQSQTSFKDTRNKPDKQAVFSGGTKALFDYFGQEYESLEDTDSVLLSPENMICRDFIIARISILADGSVGEVNIAPETPTPHQYGIFEKIKDMPKWEPAIKNGEPIDAEYLLPLKLNRVVLKDYIGPVAPNDSLYLIEYIPIVKSSAIPNIDYCDFVTKNFSYPEDALDAGIQGKVVALVTISNDGQVEDIEITNGIHPSCDIAVKELINLIPSWTPTIMNGEYVRSTVPFPVVFQYE